VLPIAVKLMMHIVEILPFAYGDFNIMAINAGHSHANQRLRRSQMFVETNASS
jgi:hypothetical protein